MSSQTRLRKLWLALFLALAIGSLVAFAAATHQAFAY